MEFRHRLQRHPIPMTCHFEHSLAVTGVLHFQPGAVWRARATAAGLIPESDTAITPFVHRLVCRR